MEFRHTVDLRSLETDDGDEIAGQLAGLEGRLQIVLAVEDAGGGLDHLMLRFDRGNLDHGLAEIAREHLQSTVGLEGFFRAADDLWIGADLGSCFADHSAVRAELGFDSIGRKSLTPDRADIFVHIARLQELRDEISHAAGCVEVVHVS